MNGDDKVAVTAIICVASVIATIVMAFYMAARGNEAKELQMMQDCIAAQKNWAVVMLHDRAATHHECVESNFQRTGWVQPIEED